MSIDHRRGDSSEAFIAASIEEVFKTIGEAAVIVVVVILLFLGSFRSVHDPDRDDPAVAGRRLLRALGARLFDQLC